MFKFNRKTEAPKVTGRVWDCRPIERPNFPMNTGDVRIAAREDEYLSFLAGSQ